MTPFLKLSKYLNILLNLAALLSVVCSKCRADIKQYKHLDILQTENLALTSCFFCNKIIRFAILVLCRFLGIVGGVVVFHITVSERLVC